MTTDEADAILELAGRYFRNQWAPGETSQGSREVILQAARVLLDEPTASLPPLVNGKYGHMIKPTLEQPCEAHKTHQPHPLTVELHHVVPVAWQLTTPLMPGVTPPFPGRDPDGRGMLWDTRGMWLCPTGHRNTHHWIVALMHEIARLNTEDIHLAYNNVKGSHPAAIELGTAYLALGRFAGFGSLVRLTQLGQWGQA